MPPPGFIELSYQMVFLDGPADGETKERVVTTPAHVPAEFDHMHGYNLLRTSDNSNIVYVYRLVRIEKPAGEQPKAYYRYYE